VSKKQYCFTFNSYNETLEIINICKNKKIQPVIYLRYYLLNGFGIDWYIELKELIKKDLKFLDFKIYGDVKTNYGLFIGLVENKIDFLKVKANNKILKKLNEIAKLNKVLINPNFSVVDLSKIKNKITKIK
tara:strand:+ start:99 stop:491 length:393 start_codon:yes stop_codon:yes gene_type:complete